MAIRMVTCPGCGSVQKDGTTCPLCKCPVNDEMRAKLKKERENKPLQK